MREVAVYLGAARVFVAGRLLEMIEGEAATSTFRERRVLAPFVHSNMGEPDRLGGPVVCEMSADMGQRQFHILGIRTGAR